jgi:hypothetical protein
MPDDAASSSPQARATSTPSAERRAPRADEMDDQTPRTPGDLMVNAESRLNALRDAGPKRRQQLVWVQYDGRKGTGGAVRRTQDEHIDVIVPDEDNEGAADLYLDQVSPAGVITPETKQQLKDQGISHETLQLSGQHYHFVQGLSTPVDPSHADWLLAHKGLAFSTVDAPS